MRDAGRVPRKGKTGEGFSYSLNQEKNLKRFLDDGAFPMDSNLKLYEYFEYLLTEIPQHLDGTDRGFCEVLLPWSDKLPAGCRK